MPSDGVVDEPQLTIALNSCSSARRRRSCSDALRHRRRPVACRSATTTSTPEDVRYTSALARTARRSSRELGVCVVASAGNDAHHDPDVPRGARAYAGREPVPDATRSRSPASARSTPTGRSRCSPTPGDWVSCYRPGAARRQHLPHDLRRQPAAPGVRTGPARTSTPTTSWAASACGAGRPSRHPSSPAQLAGACSTGAARSTPIDAHERGRPRLGAVTGELG